MTSLLAILLVGTSLLYLLQDQMIFLPQPISAANLAQYRSQERYFDRGDARLHGWLLQGDKFGQEPLILYFGGNAEELSSTIQHLQGFGTESLLLVNYRGYGASSGKPSERTLYADALFLYDWLTKTQGLPAQNIIVMGRSLGAGVATYLASQRTVRAVILISPYDSLVAVGQLHYPYLPVDRFLRHRFAVAPLASKITTPVLALMAEQDRVIPTARSDALLQHWGGPVQRVKLAGAGHNTIGAHPQYRPAINGFIRSLFPDP